MLVLYMVIAARLLYGQRQKILNYRNGGMDYGHDGIFTNSKTYLFDQDRTSTFIKDWKPFMDFY